MLNLRSFSGKYLLTRNRVAAFSKKVFQMDRGSRYPDKLRRILHFATHCTVSETVEK